MMDDDNRFRVEVASNPPGRVQRVHTRGLWWIGLPELFTDVPAHFSPGDDESDWTALAFLLAAALATLGQELMQAEAFDLEPHHDIFRGRPVQSWLARHEAPDEDLASRVGSEVDTVIRVECSLWSAVP